MSENSPTPMTSINNQIDDHEALRRIQELDPVMLLGHMYSRVKRATRMQDGSQETNGDHVVQLQLATLAYVSKYYPELDHGRIVRYVLIHDIVEAIILDECSLGLNEAALQAKEAREKAAIAEIAEYFRDYPAVMEYVYEYEELRYPEARIVKAMDKLMPGYSHFRDEGAILHEMGVSSYEQLVAATAASDARLEVYAEAFPDIIRMRKELHKYVAQTAFRVLQSHK